MLIQKLRILAIIGLFLPLLACSSGREDVNLAAVPPDAFSVRADAVVIIKSERRMILYSRGHELKEYSIGLGREPNGPKLMQGDGRTPEGRYFIDYHKPNSEYHMALHISYPNERDRARAAAFGVSPGGGIMIHGISPEHAYMGRYMRTEGCIAVTNPDIEEIWSLVPDHTPVDIRA